jgi:hypothetical protein
MIKYLPGERWKIIQFYRNSLGKSYAISNHGRLVCFDKKISTGTLLRGSLQEGYPIWRYRKKRKHGKYTYEAVLIHRLVAECFLPKPQKGETVIMHLNHNKTDNHYANLAWCTFQESSIHAQASPRVKKARKLMQEKGIFSNAKLTAEKVSRIKKLLKKGNTLKSIAGKFNVSDMQVYRIKTGENWKQVK